MIRSFKDEDTRKVWGRIKVPFTGAIDLDAGDAFGSEVAQVVMDIDLVNGILQPISVKIVGRDGHPVTGTTLRQVPVKGMAADLIQSVIAAREDTATGTRVPVGRHSPIHLDDAQKARLRDQGPVEESLRAVANFYEFGRVTGYPPAKFVEDNLGLPRTTASKWVRRAREAGFLQSLTTTAAKKGTPMPDFTPIHPGEILATEFLDPLGITPYALAKAMRVPQTRIGEILKGKRAVTVETALRLSRALGTSEMFWVNLQARYDAETVKDAEHDDLDRIPVLA